MFNKRQKEAFSVGMQEIIVKSNVCSWVVQMLARQISASEVATPAGANIHDPQN